MIIGTVFIAGCSWSSLFKSKKTIVPMPEITTKCCRLAQFKSIVVKDGASVELVNGSPAIEISGIRADKYDCQSFVVNNILYVSNNIKDKAPNVVMKVTAPDLKNITVMDRATINAEKFKGNNLVVTAKGKGDINLEGQINVKNIFQLGSGRINIDWVDSVALRVDGSGSGPICLAGRVDNMIVKLVKSSNLNARYLRARNASVFTVDKSTAEVTAIESLGAFAVDHSSIYYYKTPDKITVVTRDSGNVLQLGWMQ